MTNFLGVDNGQASDPAAWALIERKVYAGRPIIMETVRAVAHAELHATAYSRFPLRTPYTEMVRQLGVIVRTPDFYGDMVVVVDCTRERAVYDIMRESGDFYGTTIIPMTITSGTHVTVDKWGWYGVPEAELMAALITSLESDRLKLFRGGGQAKGDAEAMDEQTKNIRRRVSRRRSVVGMTSDGTEAEHDDLAFALAFAVWYAKYTGALEGPRVYQDHEVKPFDPARHGLTE